MMGHKFKKGQREIVFNKYNGKCAYCGIKLNNDSFTIDHIEPKFRGYRDDQLKRKRGQDIIDNYNPCCLSCNSSKSTLTIENWRSEINLKFNRLLKYSSSFNLLFRMGMIKRNGECKFYFEKYHE